MRYAIPSALLTVFLLSGCASLVGGGAATVDDVRGLPQGASQQAVVDSLGKPWDVNVTESQYGRREQWVYQKAWTKYDRIYLYFENGKLVSRQY